MGADPPVRPFIGPQLQNQSELRAPTAEKAAFYLDAALAAREDAQGGSHVLFTLHVYQYRVEKCGRGGSRWPRASSWDQVPSAPDSPGRPGSGGPGAEPSPPALGFQCPEAAAACTSLTWAAVKRPPGAPHPCPCQPWAASSWRWSAEPSTCPTGKCGLLGGPGDPAQTTSAVSTVSMVLDPSWIPLLPEGWQGVLLPGARGHRGGCQTRPGGPQARPWSS